MAQLPPKPTFEVAHWPEDVALGSPRKQPYVRRHREEEPLLLSPMHTQSSYNARGSGDTYIPRDTFPPRERDRERETWDRDRDRTRDRDRDDRGYRTTGGPSTSSYPERQSWDERDRERYRRERDREPRLDHERDRLRDWERDRGDGRYDRDSYRHPGRRLESDQYRRRSPPPRRYSPSPPGRFYRRTSRSPPPRRHSPSRRKGSPSPERNQQSSQAPDDGGRQVPNQGFPDDFSAPVKGKGRQFDQLIDERRSITERSSRTMPGQHSSQNHESPEATYLASGKRSRSRSGDSREPPTKEAKTGHNSDKSGGNTPIRGSDPFNRSRNVHLSERNERPFSSRREEKRPDRGATITEDYGRGGQESRRVPSHSSGSGAVVDNDRPSLRKLSIPPPTPIVASRLSGSSQQGSASPFPGSAIPHPSEENTRIPTGPRSLPFPSLPSRLLLPPPTVTAEERERRRLRDNLAAIEKRRIALIIECKRRELAVYNATQELQLPSIDLSAAAQRRQLVGEVLASSTSP